MRRLRWFRAGAACVWLAACAQAPRPGCDASGVPATICGFENPEDLVAAEPGALIVSQMRRDGSGGNLVVWSEGAGSPERLWPLAKTPGLALGPAAGDPSCPPPEAGDFAPHGVTLQDETLYVVNHGGRESVELFRVGDDDGRLTARWVGCVELPDGTSANDVAVSDDGTIVVSNMSPPGQMVRASLESLAGWKTGDVLAWQSGLGWTHVPNTAASVPNGVAVTPDGQRVFYAESGAERVVSVRSDGSGRREFPVPGRPDNLSWTPEGRLFVATHASFLDLARCLRARPCRSGWAIYEIDPESGDVREALAHDGERLGAVASAQPAGDRVYLSAVFDDRIGVWSPEGER